MRFRLSRVSALVCVVVLAGNAPAAAQSFKVASWNIRSGRGITGLAGFPKTFDSNTSNCADAAYPLNAWGVGVPQKVLALLNGDPGIVALSLQEAWLCGSPENVARVLGWRSFVVDNQNGTSLVARHGFAKPVVTQKLTSEVATDPSWIVGAEVCLDPGCLDSVTVHATHWKGEDPFVITQALETIDFMDQTASPRILIGDLNAYPVDPRTSIHCADGSAAPALPLLRDAGYVDAWSFLYGMAEGFTATVNRNGCGVPSGAAFKRIDYSWSKGLAPISMTRFGIPAASGAEAPSDHYGIIAEYMATPPPANYSEIVLHGGRAPLAIGNYQARSDTTAAGGYAMTNPDAGAPKLLAARAAPSSYFEIAFHADAGKPYRLWIRGKAQSDSWANDSVYVQFSDSIDAAGLPVYRIDTASATAVSLEQGLHAGMHGWGWTDNGYGSNGPLIRFAATGEHRIRVQVREDGLAIDQIVLSSGTYLSAAPGQARDDSTILPLP